MNRRSFLKSLAAVMVVPAALMADPLPLADPLPKLPPVPTPIPYYQIQWPKTTKTYEYGVYADETLPPRHVNCRNWIPIEVSLMADGSLSTAYREVL